MAMSQRQMRGTSRTTNFIRGETTQDNPNFMRTDMKAIIVLCVAAMLSACSVTTGDSLQRACNSAKSAYAAYLVVAATGDISPKTRAKVEAAFLAAAPVCDDPTKYQSGDILMITAQVYAAISTAYKEARK